MSTGAVAGIRRRYSRRLSLRIAEVRAPKRGFSQRGKTNTGKVLGEQIDVPSRSVVLPFINASRISDAAFVVNQYVETEPTQLLPPIAIHSSRKLTRSMSHDYGWTWAMLVRMIKSAD